MADNWQDEYLAMVQDCQQRFGLLSVWEQGFIDSLRVRMDRPLFVISPKQLDKLEAIWGRVTEELPAVAKDNFDQQSIF